MTPSPLDPLIIGAGPVGLATAAAALQHGVKNILVVEQARELRPTGDMVDILPNGYRFLCQIAPEIEPSLQPFRHKYQSGKPRLCQFAQLQQLLVNVLPKDILILNHQLVDIVHDDDAGLVYANFVPDRQRRNEVKNWMGDDDYLSSTPTTPNTQSLTPSSDYFVPVNGERLVSCAAKIIVGADGINSVARRCVCTEIQGLLGKTTPMPYTVECPFSVCLVQPGIISESHNLSLDYVDKASMALITCNPDVVAFDTVRVMLGRHDKNSKSPVEWIVAYQMPIDEHTVRNACDGELQQYTIEKSRSSGFSED